ncbi:MAG: MarR family winged helix-turn-helix transcriptional regulator [Sporolactobacillus sp.]
MDEMYQSAEIIAQFCRTQINVKKNIPIRNSEMGVLIYLVRSKEAVTPLQIAQFFAVSKPMVTEMINSLNRKKYLIKHSDQTDGRSYKIAPTSLAKELVNESYKEYLKMLYTLETKMGQDDFRQLVHLISKANQILAEEK